MNLVSRGADALALCGLGQRRELLEFLRQRDLPCVHVMSLSDDPAVTSVGFDNAAAITQAVRYLLDLGHRRIAMLAGVMRDNDRATARVEGVRRALAAAGLDLPPHRLVERRYGIAAAREGFRELMATNLRPTAIVCGNDVLAFGALLEAQREGIEVPKSLSIVGFDDLELANQVHPALTTVRVPAEEMWNAAADRLLGSLRGDAVQRRTEIEVSLVVRSSTGPATER
jgi:LacI family transcriptional regulator